MLQTYVNFYLLYLLSYYLVNKCLLLEVSLFFSQLSGMEVMLSFLLNSCVLQIEVQGTPEINSMVHEKLMVSTKLFTLQA